MSSQELIPDRNRSPDIGPPHQPIAIELDLYLHRTVTEWCGGRVVLPFGVRRRSNSRWLPPRCGCRRPVPLSLDRGSLLGTANSNTNETKDQYKPPIIRTAKAERARDTQKDDMMNIADVELPDELSPQEIMAEQNRSPDIGPPPRPIAIELDLCLYRAVTECCGGRVVFPFGVRRLIKDFAFVSFDNQTLRQAVRLWGSDRAQAISIYGQINDWDVSRVTDMALLFCRDMSFNDRIDGWDVRYVTSMDRMFYCAVSFNQPLSTWNVHRVTTMKSMFCGTASFNQPLDTWDVRQVTDMSCLFSHANSFNQPLSTWQVGQVTDMSNMFDGAATFNQPLTAWDVRQVRNMRGMFFEATSFNGSLDTWEVRQVAHWSVCFNALFRLTNPSPIGTSVASNT